MAEEGFPDIEPVAGAHHRMFELSGQYEHVDGLEDRRALVDSLTEAIRRHLADCADLLAALERVAERPDLIDQTRKVNHTLESLVDKLQCLHVRNEEFDRTFQLVHESLRAHVELEESLLVPLAKQKGIDLPPVDHISSGHEPSSSAA